MKRFILAFSFSLVFFFSLTFVKGEKSAIIVNEIGAYESTGYEWIEIYNRSENDIDLTGYTFWEDNAKHRLTLKQGEIILQPQSFALIVQDDKKFLEKYPTVTSTIFDSSWGSLSEGGEEVGLKDAQENFVEQFTYIAAENFSLERIDPQNDDYTLNNWKEHESSNTAGTQNSVFVQEPIEEAPPEEVIEEPQDEEIEIPPEEATSTDPLPEDPIEEAPPAEDDSASSPQEESENQEIEQENNSLVINEIMPDPNEGEKEWIELYNFSTTSIDLTGWKVEDGSGEIAAPTSTIEANSFIVVELSSSKLNNSGDKVILKNKKEEVVNEISFEDWKRKGNSYARVSLENNTFAETTVATKGQENRIEAPVLPSVPVNSGSGSSGGGSIEPSVSQEIILPPGAVVINEVYPNPPGVDTENEFIELYNTTNNIVDLKDAKILDSSGTSFKVNTTLQPLGYAVFYRKQTKISLNNTGEEEIILQNKNGEKIDTIQYEDSAREGESYSRDSEGKMVWSVEKTPGVKNSIKEKNIPPQVRVEVDTEVGIGEVVPFDASDTVDPENEKLVFTWDFGGGTRDEGILVEHSFEKEGNYTVMLTVTDGVNTVEKKIEIQVKQKSAFVGGNFVDVTPFISISEVVPAPINGQEEFIEIYNSSSTTLDISGFQLDDQEGGSRAYTIPENTFIDAFSYKVFPKSVTKLALNNSEESIRLLSPDETLIEEVQYEQAEDGQSYIKNDEGKWVWTSSITPEKKNIFAINKNEDKKAKVSTTKKKATIFQSTTLEQLNEYELGSTIKISGIITALPNTFGSQYFYISNASSTAGVQVYMSKKDFPELALGDRIEVVGELAQAYGETRIKVKEKNDIKFIEHSGAVSPQEIEIAQIDEPLEGNLVKVKGEITEVKSTYMYVDDGTDEVKIYFKRGTGIQKKNVALGDTVEVSGIVSQTQSGYQLLPRFEGDIVTIASASSAAVTKPSESDGTGKTILTATAGGFTSLLLGFLAKVHGNKALGWAKRVGAVAATLGKRNKG